MSNPQAVRQDEPQRQQVAEALDQALREVRRIEQRLGAAQQPGEGAGTQGSGARIDVQQKSAQITVEQRGQSQVSVERQDEVRVEVVKPGQQQRQAQAQDGGAAQQSGQQQAEQRRTEQAGRQVSASQAEQWVGKRIYSSEDRDIGEIAAFRAGNDGNVQAFHADIGGFLGLGETRVQVEPRQFEMRGDRLYLNMTKQQAMDLPRVQDEGQGQQSR